MGRIVREGPVVPAERAKAFMEADEILVDARSRADEIIRSAMAEADSIRERAQSDGLREAREEAGAMLITASHAKSQMLDDVQADVVTLAMEVARKIIREELELRPEVVVELCSDLMKQVVLAKSLTLKVHPDDLEMVRGHEALLATGLDKDVSFRLAPDTSIERGGCVIESDMGKIDARIETQLAAIERALMAEDG